MKLTELYGRYLVQKIQEEQKSPLVPQGASSSRNPSGAIPVEIKMKPESWSVPQPENKWSRLNVGDIVYVDIARLEEYDKDLFFIREEFIFGKTG